MGGQERPADQAGERVDAARPTPAAGSPKVAAPPAGAADGDAAVPILSETGAVLREALGRYVRSAWSGVDVLLIVAVFAVCFGGPFDTQYFFSTAALPLALLSALGTYALMHGVMPPEETLALGRRDGPIACAGGLMLAAAAGRAAASLLLTLLALAFGRFTEPSLGALLAGALGLALEGALVAALLVALSAPLAPRNAPLVALAVLVLSLAAFDTVGTGGVLGASVWVCRLPLLPFGAAYSLGLQDIPAWGWVEALTLAPAAFAGLVWLAAHWLGRRLEAASGGMGDVEPLRTQRTQRTQRG